MKSEERHPLRDDEAHPALDTGSEYSKAPRDDDIELSPLERATHDIQQAPDAAAAIAAALRSLAAPAPVGARTALLFLLAEGGRLLSGAAACCGEKAGTSGADDDAAGDQALISFVRQVRIPTELGAEHPLVRALTAERCGLLLSGEEGERLAAAFDPPLDTESYLVLPVPDHDAARGVLLLCYDDADRPAESQARGAALLLAAHLGSALERIASAEQLAHRVRAWDTLHETTGAILASGSLADALTIAARGAASVLQAGRAVVWTCDEADEPGRRRDRKASTAGDDSANGLHLVAQVAQRHDDGPEGITAALQRIAERAAAHRTGLIFPDLTRTAQEELAQIDEPVPAVAVPLIAHGELVGVLAAALHESDAPLSGGGFGESDQELLALLGGYVAHVIQASRLTERERAARKRLSETQERLIQSEKLAALGEVSIRAAEEIRNPLIAIGGFARRIERALAEGDPARENAGMIAAEARRLEDLIDQQLELARSAAPRLTKQRLNELIQNCVGLLRDDVLTRGVLLEETYSEQVPELLLDGERIRQVVVNILRTALETVGDGDTVRIETFRQRDRVLLEVAHTGERMPGEILEQLFVPFAAARPSGRGLGLAVAYQIVKEHGGEIAVRSEGEWSAVYTIGIPIRSNQERRRRRDRRAGRDRRGRKPRPPKA